MMNSTFRPWIAVIASAVALVWAASAMAQNAKPPTQITYQGFLTDGDGAPFGSNAPVNKTVIFRIFGVATGGTPIWSSQQVVTVDKGYFSVLLGQGSSVGSEPFDANMTSVFVGPGVSDRYLELTVDGTTVAPRLRFLAAPYALLAKSASDLVDPITGANALAISNGNLATSGNISANRLSGDGANLTGLDATKVATGTLDPARVPNLDGGKIASGTINDARLSGNISRLNANETVTGNRTFNGPVTMGNASNSLAGFGTIPLGGIIMWSGAINAIPQGWKLCDGTQGTPDLRDRFIVGGGGAYPVGGTGGASSVRLSAGNLPSFQIQYQDIFHSEGGGSVDVPEKRGSGDTDKDNKGWEITRTATFNGSANPVNILPPYFALAYIMRVQ